MVTATLDHTLSLDGTPHHGYLVTFEPRDLVCDHPRLGRLAHPLLPTATHAALRVRVAHMATIVSMAKASGWHLIQAYLPLPDGLNHNGYTMISVGASVAW